MNDRANAGAAHGGAQAAGPTTEERLEAVLSVLAHRASCAQAALCCGVPEDDVERWRRLFVDSGRIGLLESGRLKPEPPGSSLGARNADLKSALLMMLVEVQSYQRTAHGHLGPFAKIEQIRRDSEITISRFCLMIGMSRRTYFRRLALLRPGLPAHNGHDVTSIMLTCAQLVEDYVAKHPGYGYRRIHELMIADGHMVSASTVLRAIHVTECQPNVATQESTGPATPIRNKLAEDRAPEA